MLQNRTTSSTCSCCAACSTHMQHLNYNTTTLTPRSSAAHARTTQCFNHHSCQRRAQASLLRRSVALQGPRGTTAVLGPETSTCATVTTSTSRGLQVHVPGLPRPIEFVSMGSGLLWARTTGLKVWPGALLLTRIMQHQMDTVQAAVAAAAGRKAEGEAAGSCGEAGVKSGGVPHHMDGGQTAVAAAGGHAEGDAADVAEGRAEGAITGYGKASGSWGGGASLSDQAAGTSGPAWGAEGHWSWEDKVVVELGCGLGLCSMVASCLGAQALATDGDADLVRIARKNAAHNTQVQRHPAATAVLPWGEDEALRAALLKLLPRQEQQALQQQSGGNSCTGAQAAAMGAPDGLQARTTPGGGRLQPGGEQEAVTREDGAGRSGQGQVAVDVVLMSDVVYGSNPGVWERLVHTLSGLCTVGRDGGASAAAAAAAVAAAAAAPEAPAAAAAAAAGADWEVEEVGLGPVRHCSALSAPAAYRNDSGTSSASGSSGSASSGNGGSSTSSSSSSSGSSRSGTESRTLVLQCETRRLEGVLYDEYWGMLKRAGFACLPLENVLDCTAEGEGVRAWVLWLT